MGDTPPMLSIDLTGKRALVAGVADDGGFGFAIAKALAEAGATVCVGTWPPALSIFTDLLERGKLDESLQLVRRRKLSSSSSIYPLDAEFDTLADMPEELRDEQALQGRTATVSIDGLRERLDRRTSASRPLDIVVHSLANGPEVKKPLLETSRKGYLGRGQRERLLATSSMVQRLGPLDAAGRLVPVAHVHGERARDPRLRRRHVVGEGGARERHAHARLRGRPQVGPPREHASRAGPLASRAASAIGIIERDDRVLQGERAAHRGARPPTKSARPRRSSRQPARRAASPARTVYVDKGYHHRTGGAQVPGARGGGRPAGPGVGPAQHRPPAPPLPRTPRAGSCCTARTSARPLP